jgi:hypothetical protein
MKSVQVLSILPENPLDATQERPGFKVSGLLYFREKLQHMNVDILWRCKECLHNSNDHF